MLNKESSENSPLMMSNNEARKALKGVKWPEFDDTITIDTFKRIFQFQIDSAKNKNIPDDMIKDSIVQHLMSSKCMAEFANLTEEIPPSSLENVIKIIHQLDPEGQCMEPEERFKAIKASSPSRRAGPDCHGMHSDGEIHLWRCPLYHNFRKISSALPIHGIPKNQNLHNSVISIQNPQNFFGKVKFTIKQHFIHRLQQLRARFLIF